MTTPHRHPAGTPVGGQFAAHRRGEPDTTLDDAAGGVDPQALAGKVAAMSDSSELTEAEIDFMLRYDPVGGLDNWAAADLDMDEEDQPVMGDDAGNPRRALSMAASAFIRWQPRGGSRLIFDGEDDEYSPLDGVAVTTPVAGSISLSGPMVEPVDVDEEMRGYAGPARDMLRRLLDDAADQQAVVRASALNRGARSARARSDIMLDPELDSWSGRWALRAAFPALDGEALGSGHSMAELALLDRERTTQIGTVAAEDARRDAVGAIMDDANPHRRDRCLQFAYPNVPDRTRRELAAMWRSGGGQVRERVLARFRLLDELS